MHINIQYIAKLAGLRIADAQIPQYEKSIEAMLEMVNELPELAEEALLDASNPMQLREDIAADSYFCSELLQNAPETKAGCFVVPQTVE